MNEILAEIYSTVLSGAPFVIGAYALIWAVLFIFVIMLLVRFNKVNKEIDILKDALEARGISVNDEE